MAQSISALAHGNLLRPENGQDRFSGILGIHDPGKKTAAALSKLDRRDGKLRSSETEEPIDLKRKILPSCENILV